MDDVAPPGADPALLPLTATGGVPLQFVHIPKNAGTTMEDLGAANGIDWARNRGDWPNSTWYVCSPWHEPPATFTAHGVNPYAGADTFCIVRNPYDKAISEFVYANMSPDSWYSGYTHCIHREAFLAIPSCDQYSLNEWLVRALGKLQGEIGRSRASSISSALGRCGDCHFVPQWMYVDGDGAEGEHATCQNVLKLESLSTAFSALMNQYNCPVMASADLGAYQDTAATTVHDCNLSASDLNATALGLIHDIYARDFEQFGYDQLPTIIP